ncbi:MAG: MJ0042-type zinc finger domain-containing protein [Bradyrhizobium sp.]
MHIVCPHCTTAYAIDPATLGAAGRSVRCSHCKEVWLARPQDAVEAVAPESAMAAASPPQPDDAAAEWDAMAREAEETPVVDSPSIAGDFPADHASSSHIDEGDWQTMARRGAEDFDEDGGRRPWFRAPWNRSAPRRSQGASSFKSTVVCAAMGALVAALLIWRVDVVRLLPQTAAFYRMAGLNVNLRGVRFENIKVSTETVEGKPMLVIQGNIVGDTTRPVNLPRLRFSVLDAHGAEIYAWNTLLEKTVLRPGERAFFRSRLASPPAEGRSIDIRFFNKHDIADGSI